MIERLKKGCWTVTLHKDGSIWLDTSFKNRHNHSHHLGKTDTILDKHYLPNYVIQMINIIREKNPHICGLWIRGKYLGEVIDPYQRT